MAFSLTIEGTVLDQNTDPVAGMTVLLKNDPLEQTVDSAVTDASGYYFLQTSDAGEYYADPQALAPHYSDPGTGPLHSFDGLSNDAYVDDFESTFSNQAPSVANLSSESWEEDSGTKFKNGTMSDTDGDDLTPVKTQGPSWGTLSQTGPTSFQWSFNTATPAPGGYTFGVKAQDEYGLLSTEKTFTVTITDANNPPDLDNPGPKVYTHGTGTKTFFLNATDADDDDLTFSKDSGGSYGSVHSTSGQVSINTNTGSIGQDTFGWQVSDGRGGTDVEYHTVTIRGSLKADVDIVVSGSGEPTRRLASSGVSEEIVFSASASATVIPPTTHRTTASGAIVVSVVGAGEAVPPEPVQGEADVDVILTATGTGKVEHLAAATPQVVFSTTGALALVNPTAVRAEASVSVVFSATPQARASYVNTGSVGFAFSTTGEGQIARWTKTNRQRLEGYGRWTQFQFTHEEAEQFTLNGFLIRAYPAGERRDPDTNEAVRQRLMGSGRMAQFKITHEEAEEFRLDGFVIYADDQGEY